MKSKTIYEEKINDDLFVYVFQLARKKFVVMVDHGEYSEKISSHSCEWKASESFEKTITKLQSERK